MNREYGEKSYKPGIFKIDKWVMDWSPALGEIDKLFDIRKIPGNILLTAYYTPLTIEEISMELGVAAPYLEDEINILLGYNLLKQFQNGRYQTNIFIYTTACNEDIMLKTKELYKKHAKKLNLLVDGKTQEVKELLFKNDDEVSQNKLKWFTSHFILWHALLKSQGSLEMPPVGGEGGGTGYLWGLNYERFEHGSGSGFHGIYGQSDNANYDGWIHSSNYCMLEKCQPHYPHHSGYGRNNNNDILFAAAHKSFEKFTPDEIAQFIREGYIEKDGDSYKTSCPVMTSYDYENLREICSDAVGEMNGTFTETISVIAEVMKNHAPSAIQGQCENLAIVKSGFDSMGNIMQNLVESGYLIIPTQREFLTIYAVI